MTVERMKLSRLGAFVRRGGALALIPLVMALVLAGLWWITNEEIRLLRNDGVDAQATVVSRNSRMSGSGDTRRTNYYVRVAFSDPSDRPIVESAEVRSAFYGRVREGDDIDIRYVPGDPILLEIDPEIRGKAAFWSAQIALLSVVVCIGMIWNYWRESAKTYRAVNRGEVREAHVTGHVSTANPQVKDTSKEKDRRYMLKWYDARDQFGMGGKLKQHELEKYPVGTVIVIYTDPVSGEIFWEGQI